MTSQTLLFATTGFLALVGALGTVLSDRPLRAAMSLLLTVMSVAGLYLSLHAELLASLQMLVYAGAVVVLFVFVIMLIGPDGHATKPTDRTFSPILATLLLGFFAVVVASLVGRGIPDALPAAPAGYGSVESLGQAIYLEGAVPFEAISITLLVAILAAIAVARGRTQHETAALERDRVRRANEPPVVEEGDGP